MQELQNWLTQANIMLSGAASQAQENAGGNEMSPLASRPETIRFAVQDTISQLASMLENSKVLQLESNDSLKQLVHAFHEILNRGVERTTNQVQKNPIELDLSSGGTNSLIENNPATASSPVKQLLQESIQLNRVLNENSQLRSLNLNGQAHRNDLSVATVFNQSLVSKQGLISQIMGFRINRFKASLMS